MESAQCPALAQERTSAVQLDCLLCANSGHRATYSVTYYGMLTAGYPGKDRVLVHCP